MITNRQFAMEDYLAMARRNWLWIAVPGLIGPIIGFLVSFAFAPKYTSSSLLVVEGQILPTGYVNPIITEHVSDRMVTLQQNVLSRSRLQPLVARLGLVRKGKSVDDAIDEIRYGTAVYPSRRLKEGAASGATNDVPGFNVSFTTDNPRDAQEVCAEVTSLLIAENLEEREQVARSTTDFLSRELEQAKQNLNDMEAKLSQFKLQHMGRMPGDIETNLRILAGLNSQLEVTTQNISRLQQDKSYAEMLLGQQLDANKSAQAAPSYATTREQLVSLQNRLVTLQTRYTDEFPDVVKTKHEIAALQAKLKEFNSEAETSDTLREATVPREAPKMEPPEIMRLREQIWHTDTAIEHFMDAQKKAQERIDAFQSRAIPDPEIEEEWKQLTRDNGTAHNIYNQLLTNKSTAEIQTQMERNQEGEQMKLLDPASLPNKASYPIRSKFAMYGLVAGLALGGSIAVFLEIKDKSIRNEGDVAAALELPMLTAVPWTGTEGNGGNWKERFRRPFTPRFEKQGPVGRS